MHQAHKLYAQESLGMDLYAAAFALDSTTIDLCLSLFPRAHFRSAKSTSPWSRATGLRRWGGSRCTRCSICVASYEPPNRMQIPVGFQAIQQVGRNRKIPLLPVLDLEIELRLRPDS